MNREILFRGKRMYGGVWLYGSLRQYKDGTSGICDRELEHTYRVDPITVGEYTGLTDKNGKRIFEEDIISNQHPSVQKAYTVIWFSGGFVCRTKDDRYLWLSVLNCNEFEVIGNIHDNPELMEGE